MEVWRERMRVARRQRVRAADRQRAPRGGRVAAAHARPAVRAGLRPGRGRARARARRRLHDAHDGPEPARGPRRRGGRAAASASSRSTTRPCCSRRTRSRLPFQLMLAPRVPRPRFEDDGPTGAALLHDGLCRLARHLGSSPPLNMWVRTAPRGVEQFCWRIDVLPRLTHLAGLELSTELNLNIVAPEDAAALLRELAAPPQVRLPPMPPEQRFVPRFAAEPPQEALPYGRWEERLREEFLAAALELDGRAGGPRRAGRDRVVPRPHLARAHLRAGDARPPTAATSCSATCASARGRGRRAERLLARTSTSPRRRPSATPTGRWTSATR